MCTHPEAGSRGRAAHGKDEEWHAYVASDEGANDKDVKRKAEGRCRKAAAKAVAKQNWDAVPPSYAVLFIVL